jgi:predicted permease
MPPGVQFPDNVGIWLPRAHLPPDVRADARDGRLFQVFGRLDDGVSITQAQAELDIIGRQLADVYPATNERMSPVVRLIGDQDTASVFEVMLLQIIVACVLFIACANVAGLLLVRTARRTTEMSVRASLGASRWRMARQLVMESVVLASVAGLAAVGVSSAGVRWLTGLIGNIMEYGVAYELTIDWTVFAFLAGSALVTVGISLAPAMLVSKIDVNTTLKEGNGGPASSLRVRRWTGALVVAELALTIALLTGAGLMTRSLLARQTIDIGIDTSPLLTMRISMVPPQYAASGRRADVFRRLEERLAGLTGVEASAMTTAVPFTFGDGRAVSVDTLATDPDRTRITTLLVGDRYFDTLGIEMLSGRAFTSTDGLQGRETAIVNRRFAEMYFAGENPIGRRIRLDARDAAADSEPPWLTIVGMAPDVRQLDNETAQGPVAFLPHRSEFPRTGDLLVRASPGIDPLALSLPIQEALRQIDVDLAFFNVSTLDEHLAERRTESRRFASILATFAFLGLILSAIGIYGVVAYSVTQRTREFGLRVALGARPHEVRRLVFQVALRQLAWGLPLGLAAGLGMGQVLRSELYGTSPTDPFTLLAIVSVLVAITVAASFVPARRAARLDPIRALRHD